MPLGLGIEACGYFNAVKVGFGFLQPGDHPCHTDQGLVRLESLADVGGDVVHIEKGFLVLRAEQGEDQVGKVLRSEQIRAQR